VDRVEKEYGERACILIYKLQITWSATLSGYRARNSASLILCLGIFEITGIFSTFQSSILHAAVVQLQEKCIHLGTLSRFTYHSPYNTWCLSWVLKRKCISNISVGMLLQIVFAACPQDRITIVRQHVEWWQRHASLPRMIHEYLLPCDELSASKRISNWMTNQSVPRRHALTSIKTLDFNHVTRLSLFWNVPYRWADASCFCGWCCNTGSCSVSPQARDH